MLQTLAQIWYAHHDAGSLVVLHDDLEADGLPTEPSRASSSQEVSKFNVSTDKP